MEMARPHTHAHKDVQYVGHPEYWRPYLADPEFSSLVRFAHISYLNWTQCTPTEQYSYFGCILFESRLSSLRRFMTSSHSLQANSETEPRTDQDRFLPSTFSFISYPKIWFSAPHQLKTAVLATRGLQYCDMTPDGQSRRSLLGNDSVNRFLRKRIRKQQSGYC
jgi:hypothetical protein